MKKNKKITVPKLRIIPTGAQDKLRDFPKRLRKRTLQEQTEEALKDVPRITNETLAEHRETVLRGARKYKYPLEHSKHRILIVSISILLLGIIGFSVFTALNLYKFNSTSLFMYRVTSVVPMPVAKAGDRWVSYESYLFELRRYMHYNETQQQVDFSIESGQFQLDTYRPKALERVINEAYVKQLAAEHGVSVSNSEIDDALATLRAQNRLGDSNDKLASVTSKFFGWSINDLRRQLKQELLATKVAAKLDTDATTKADNVIKQLEGGADFAKLAEQVSDDSSTKSNGGAYADTAITMSSQEVPAQVVQALADMKIGQFSVVITTPGSLEIVKLNGAKDGKYEASHIQINHKDIQTYIQPLKEKNPPRIYISVKEIEQQP